MQVSTIQCTNFVTQGFLHMHTNIVQDAAPVPYSEIVCVHVSIRERADHLLFNTQSTMLLLTTHVPMVEEDFEKVKLDAP